MEQQNRVRYSHDPGWDAMTNLDAQLSLFEECPSQPQRHLGRLGRVGVEYTAVRDILTRATGFMDRLRLHAEPLRRLFIRLHLLLRRFLLPQPGETRLLGPLGRRQGERRGTTTAPPRQPRRQADLHEQRHRSVSAHRASAQAHARRCWRPWAQPLPEAGGADAEPPMWWMTQICFAISSVGVDAFR